MKVAILLLLSLALADARRINKKANNYAKKLADEIVDIKVNVELLKKPVKPGFNITECPNTLRAQCQLCKEKVVEDEEFCKDPKTIEEKCLCYAARHQWRTMYENVEDHLQTAEEACNFVCNTKENVKVANVTSNIKSNSGSVSAVIALTALVVLFFI